VTRRILATGLATLDIVVSEGRRWYQAGGSAANVAANLAFLGWASAFAGLIGSDNPGRRVAKDLRRNRVETTSLTLSHDASTPIVVHEILSSGHQFLFECPRCGRRFPRYQPLLITEVPGILSRHKLVDVFFFDRANAASVELAESYRSTGALVMFEPSVVGRADDFARAIRAAHVVKYSQGREPALGERLDLLPEGQVRIKTKGRLGATFRIGGAAWNEVAGFPVQVVDAAGAGDWTTAGFLTNLVFRSPSELTLDDLTEALRFGRSRRQVLTQINRMMSSDVSLEAVLFVKQRTYWNGSGCQTCLSSASA
jgi:fructokinase